MGAKFCCALRAQIFRSLRSQFLLPFLEKVVFLKFLPPPPPLLKSWNRVWCRIQFTGWRTFDLWMDSFGMAASFPLSFVLPFRLQECFEGLRLNVYMINTMYLLLQLMGHWSYFFVFFLWRISKLGRNIASSLFNSGPKLTEIGKICHCQSPERVTWFPEWGHPVSRMGYLVSRLEYPVAQLGYWSPAWDTLFPEMGTFFYLAR